MSSPRLLMFDMFLPGQPFRSRFRLRHEARPDRPSRTLNDWIAQTRSVPEAGPGDMLPPQTRPVWDCHICRSVGMVLWGQWGGIYGSPRQVVFGIGTSSTEPGTFVIDYL